MQAEPEIRIVRRCRYQDDAHWNYPVNLYPFDTFYFIRGGDGAVKVGNTVTNLEHGRVYLIPANTQYSCWCTTEIDKLYVEAYVEILPGLDVFFGEKNGSFLTVCRRGDRCPDCPQYGKSKGCAVVPRRFFARSPQNL